MSANVVPVWKGLIAPGKCKPSWPLATASWLPVATSQPVNAAIAKQRAAASAEAAQLKAQALQLQEENAALKGQVHLLKFKVDLLVDMVTLANLDCDKLEDELVAVQEASAK